MTIRDLGELRTLKDRVQMLGSEGNYSSEWYDCIQEIKDIEFAISMQSKTSNQTAEDFL
jgi:hypothetical protein